MYLLISAMSIYAAVTLEWNLKNIYENATLLPTGVNYKRAKAGDVL